MSTPGLETAPPPAAVAAPRPPPGRSDTAHAVGLAAATMGANLVAVAFTVVFTRLLGTGGYGSLAALVNLTVVLMVPGSALQVAAARAGTIGRLGHGGELAATLARWERTLLAGVVVLAAASVLAREPLAALLDVRHEWAAAAVPPAGGLWLLLCVQRGLLQATRAYRSVGLSIVLEAIGRLAIGLGLSVLGLGVTGAYIGTPASLAVTALALSLLLHRRLGAPRMDTPRHPLRALARAAAVPVAALTLVGALQNVDVIVARHTLGEDAVGIYAAATVAAKAIVWIAIGIGLYVLPEATRRSVAGEDARRVLVRALAVVAPLAAAALAIFALAPELLLRTAFGAEHEPGDAVLFTLGAAFALLAATYLAVQYQLALHHRGFLVVLAVVTAAEPGLLLLAGDDLVSFARTVMLVQAAAAVALLALSARPATRSR